MEFLGIFYAQRIVFFKFVYEDEREGPDHRCGPKVVRGPMVLCGPQMPSQIFIIYITTVVTSFVKQNSLFLLFSKIL